MRLMTCNVNGIRSATEKGFWEWALSEQPDVMCLQEIRADEKQFPSPLHNGHGYNSYVFSSARPGYSGVAIYSKEPARKVNRGMGHTLFDWEGRYLHVEFERCHVVSVYFPSGSSGEQRQTLKYEFLDHFYKLAGPFLRKRKPVIFCGDFNIAHKQIDIKNWRSNQNNSGFLPEERAWMDQFIEQGFVDAFRVLNPHPEQYTWWSNRGRAYEKNVGWRIDYHITSPSLRKRISRVDIFKALKFSDHAPLTVEYDLEH